MMQADNNYSFENGTLRQPRSNHASGAQTLHRQPSRQQFDSGFGGGYQQNSLYGENGLAGRFEQPQTQRFERIPSGGQNGYNGYDMGAPQAWNNNSNYNHSNHMAALGATTRRQAPSSRGRPGLPQGWLDQNQTSPMPSGSGFSNFGSNGMGPPPNMRNDMASDDEDLIPTAIVVKNIPFAVKKEQLVQIMTEMNLPLPYAFNYHFDNGVFRGLAFANFTTPDETRAVIEQMNHLDLHGRKLRVEYKKMLPQAERDRIEREKRERRGQLEEQHRPMPVSQLQSRQSMSSLSTAMRATSPIPSSLIDPVTGRRKSLNMNDPVTLAYFSKLVVFQNDINAGPSMAFPPHIPPEHRTLIHGCAETLGLGHESHGAGEYRQIHIFRNGSGGLSPPDSQANDPNRRGLYRAATTDFSDVRDPLNNYGPLGRQASGYLGFSENQGGGLSTGRDLRAAKSHADLRSYTPSPSHGNAAPFPAGLATNVGRYTSEYNNQTSPGQRTNGISQAPSLPHNNADVLINGLGNLNLNPATNGFGGRAASPQRSVRPMASWDVGSIGAIGSGRSASASQGRRLPATNTSFGRIGGRREDQSSRGSDELSHHGNGILESVVDE